MSKIKDQILKDQEIQMQNYSEFMEKVYDVLQTEPRLNENDIEKMEQSYCSSLSPKVNKTSRIVSSKSSNTAKAIKDVA